MDIHSKPCPSEPDTLETLRWFITGRVQGVGFRPFVYRLATEYGLLGWVQNQNGQVEICTHGIKSAQESFRRALLDHAPPLAQPRLVAVDHIEICPGNTFTIRDSAACGDVQIHVPPDYFTCDDCLAELNQPADRRYRYPFINCTQCGPRYTLIRSMPYDRANTSMAPFELCSDCAREYADPADRRFHAEPVACPVCGPRLEFLRPGQNTAEGEKALSACINALSAGEIVAVKGVGGYHLLCNARCESAVVRLRERKQRPDKPLAVMFPCPPADPLRLMLAEVSASTAEQQLVLSALRPIVLATRRPDSTLAQGIAAGLHEIGVMLPYSPLHHVLLRDFGGPLVATSGNLSGEPVLTDNLDAQQRLQAVADAFLHHNRPIVRPADDPVFRTIQHRPRTIRLGRGCAPLELALPVALPQPVIALGGQSKNTVALAWDKRVVVSPHIGDMGSARGLDVFTKVIDDLQALYGVSAGMALCDAHPGYQTTHWARTCGLPVTPVFHHRAHASALAGEHDVNRNWLVFTWDGVGYGEDGSLWGGEAMVGRPGQWRRVASMRQFNLPGGDKAAREPWRSAAAVNWEIEQDWQGMPAQVAAPDLLFHAWQRRMNCPPSSAVGRLFDAAAALTGVCAIASYEGQGPMQLEALCEQPGRHLNLPLERDNRGLWVSDWQPLVEYLPATTDSVQARAECVHATLAQALVQQALAVRQEHTVDCVGLCGGVFQNRVLTELVCKCLHDEGIEVCLGQQVPINDAGLSFGQVVEYSRSQQAG